MNYKLKEYDPTDKKTCYFPKRNINTYDVNTAAIIKYVNSDCEFIFYEGEPDFSNLSLKLTNSNSVNLPI